MYIRFIGGVIVTIGCFSVGIYVAYYMRMRIKQLREFKRIIINLEGEIFYKHSLLKEACHNVSLRSIYPFDLWLKNVCTCLDNMDDDFINIWNTSLSELYQNSYLNKNDIEICSSIGQSLGYLDIETQKNSITLDKKYIDNKILSLEKELPNKVRVSIVGGVLSGIFILMLIA